MPCWASPLVPYRRTWAWLRRMMAGPRSARVVRTDSNQYRAAGPDLVHSRTTPVLAAWIERCRRSREFQGGSLSPSRRSPIPAASRASSLTTTLFRVRGENYRVAAEHHPAERPGWRRRRWKIEREEADVGNDYLVVSDALLTRGTTSWAGLPFLVILLSVSFAHVRDADRT